MTVEPRNLLIEISWGHLCRIIKSVLQARLLESKELGTINKNQGFQIGVLHWNFTHSLYLLNHVNQEGFVWKRKWEITRVNIIRDVRDDRTGSARSMNMELRQPGVGEKWTTAWHATFAAVWQNSYVYRWIAAWWVRVDEDRGGSNWTSFTTFAEISCGISVPLRIKNRIVCLAFLFTPHAYLSLA